MTSLILCAMLELPPSLGDRLKELGVAETPRILVVSVKDQTLTLFEGGKSKSEHPVSTARNGVGQKHNTFQTPLGLHRIREKIGKDTPPGGIFEDRVFSHQIWVAPAAPKSTTEGPPPDNHEPHESDLITSRVLWLEGLEPGHNAGSDQEGNLVDSYQRFIYIHGTNHEVDIGKPASRGCIRMTNAEVISLFDQVETGDLVWIQE